MSKENCARWQGVNNNQQMPDVKECQKEHGLTKCDKCPDYPLEWEVDNRIMDWPSG